MVFSGMFYELIYLFGVINRVVLQSYVSVGLWDCIHFELSSDFV